MDEKGVFAVARSIWVDADFAPEPFTEREAWLWLIGAAVWKDARVRGNMKRPISLLRGELSFATRFLADKWQWSISRTDRFLDTLQKRDMLRDTSREGSKVYSVIKYNDFQVVGLPRGTRNGTQSGTTVGQSRDKEEALQTLETNKKEDAAPKGAIAVVEPSLPDWLPLEAWRGYLDMRRKKKIATTDRAIGMLIRKLDEMRLKGHDPTDLLDSATLGNWKSIYEPKADRNGQGRRDTAHDTFIGAGASLARDYLAADGQGSGDGGPDAVQAGRPLLSP